MAGLTPETRDGQEAPAVDVRPELANGNAAASRDGSGAPASPGLALPVDPRAVRVRLAPASRLGDEAALRVTPQAASPQGVLAQRQVLVDDEPADDSLAAAGHDRHILETAGTRTPVILGPATRLPSGGSVREVIVDGFRFVVEVESERIASLRERASRGRAAAAHGGPLDVRAIIPGKVASVSVMPGDAVVAGQQLLVVEAMKMQNELRAPRDGTIDTVGVAPGVNIEVGDLLVVIS